VSEWVSERANVCVHACMCVSVCEYLPVYIFCVYVYMRGDKLVAMPFVILVKYIKHKTKMYTVKNISLYDFITKHMYTIYTYASVSPRLYVDTTSVKCFLLSDTV
jgi:hypothetical protein